ncbi:double-strand break repair helicase AddA [Sphingomonas sp.]|uniref:double-strand break repair helicase AddA n=1 Tax=Sphingomonas sp. TaxID=28214 RepID=UPI0035C7E00E
MTSPLPPLQPEQARASDPSAHVWLSASAGTGKTQVLAARVFRLLLRGVDPGAILCLTFTKAGAAEMAGRINARLAAWVRMPAPELSADLKALGERPTPPMQERARTLFAKVLDAPGGGIRINTIHGFCQSLLAAFPVEAGLIPGFRPIEAREETLLLRETLAALLVQAEAEGRSGPVEAIGALSLRLGEQGAERFLEECARDGAALEALPSGIQPFLRRALGLPSGDIEEAIAAGCEDLDCDAIDRLGGANKAWGTATGEKHVAVISAWLDGEPAARVAALKELMAVVRTGTGTLRKIYPKQIAAEPDYEAMASELGEACAALLALRDRAAYADLLARALEIGRDYARAYAAAKRRAGAVDFDDLIAATVALLKQPGIGEWVRFKLDRTTEHVLIDEAQDTNLAQWTIVRALVEEYFVGRGVYAPSVRTLFTVGDFKQAIFGFQGTDPVFFQAAEDYFAERAAAVLGTPDMPDHERGLPFDRLSLTASWRSTAPVLEFVDAAVGAAGDEALGAVGDLERHVSKVDGPGTVELWPPVCAGGDAEGDGGEEQWIDDAVRENARRIARQVKAWLDDGLMLESKGRALRPEDVMILVKRRGDLAQLLVARLYAEGVPVAGVDRLRLNAPLAVQDLLAAIRFVLQPGDDLSLASLLVSPLIGWSQEALLARAVPRTGTLWRHLRETCPGELAPLEAMLARADFTTPYRFLEELLSGPLDGRRKLLRRLGEEARDPIEELLSAALDFEQSATPSLQRFLDWFDRGEVEIKREAEGSHDAVRVMTAHGAKGLQAPLVILADATADPDSSPRSTLSWQPEGAEAAFPVFRPRKDERWGAIDEAVTAQETRERQEHWRLFYVAATRAEERLVVAGSLSASWNGVPPEDSWYAASARALDGLAAAHPTSVAGGAGEGETRRFTGSVVHQPARIRSAAAVGPKAATPLPDWSRRPAPAEARPPRPLAPSSLGHDEVADPPPTPAMRAAAERGRLIHALFERLPAVPADEREGAAERWLAAQQVPPQDRPALIATVCGVLADPAHAAVFGPQSLAEAPISAVLADGTVVAGTVDRLLVEDGRVTVIDFKTGRHAPAGLAEVPGWHVRQMAAYAAALAVIFPDHAIEAALLYTAGPRLITLPPESLAFAIGSKG